MRVTAEQYILLSPEQKDRVTHVVIDEFCFERRDVCIMDARGDFEEYPGEADSRGVDHRGFIKK